MICIPTKPRSRAVYNRLTGIMLQQGADRSSSVLASLAHSMLVLETTCEDSTHTKLTRSRQKYAEDDRIASPGHHGSCRLSAASRCATAS